MLKKIYQELVLIRNYLEPNKDYRCIRVDGAVIRVNKINANAISSKNNKNQLKLEAILLESIEKELSKPLSEHYIQDVSVMAQTLIELWKL